METRSKKTKLEGINDFEKSAIASVQGDVEEHSNALEKLEARMLTLEKQVSVSENFAQLLETHTNDSKKIDKLLSRIFCELLKTDKSVKDAIIEVVEKVESSAVQKAWRRFGAWIVGAFLFIAGLVVGEIIHLFFVK